jgi:hypothetical protein
MVHSYTVPRNDGFRSFRSAPDSPLELPSTVAIDFKDQKLIAAMDYVRAKFQLHADVMTPYDRIKEGKSGPQVFERDNADLKQFKTSLQKVQAKLRLAMQTIPTHLQTIDGTLQRFQ